MKPRFDNEQAHSEELNNEILDVWAHQNPDKAFPNA